MIQTGSRIVSNEQIAKDRWRMTLQAPRIAAEVIPGQFINVKIEKPNAPLFRRPFSVFRRISLRGGVSGIEVVYKVVGIGTEMTFKAALMRTESRISHKREDFVDSDDGNWLKWIIIQMRNDKMEFRKELVPLEKYREPLII
jgi:NAD(P)H-flavin reductase